MTEPVRRARAEARPPLTVIVPTRDRPDKLARCLTSLAAARGPEDEILVVDSASARPEATAAVAASAGARLIRCGRPGASRARNCGWRAAVNDLVAFVDDDVRVHVGWADAVALAFADHPDVAFVSGRMDLPPGQELQERPVAVLEGRVPRVLDLTTRSGDLGHSANLAARRPVLDELGGFDEQLGAGGRFRAAEDLDLLDRILLTGRVGRYEPEALGWHDQWRTRWELVRLDWGYGIGMGVRIAKLARSLAPRARREALTAIWGYGLVEVPGAVMRRSKFGTLTALARVGGTVVGMAEGLTVRVADGHLLPAGRERRYRRPSAAAQHPGRGAA